MGLSNHEVCEQRRKLTYKGKQKNTCKWEGMFSMKHDGFKGPKLPQKTCNSILDMRTQVNSAISKKNFCAIQDIEWCSKYPQKVGGWQVQFPNRVGRNFYGPYWLEILSSFKGKHHM